MLMHTLKCSALELTTALEQYVEEKVLSLNKFCSHAGEDTTVNVEIGKSTNHHQKGPYFFAEFMVQLPGVLLRAQAEEEDLYAAIDKAKDELKRQLIDDKEKHLAARHTPRPDKE